MLLVSQAITETTDIAKWLFKNLSWSWFHFELFCQEFPPLIGT